MGVGSIRMGKMLRRKALPHVGCSAVLELITRICMIFLIRDNKA